MQDKRDFNAGNQLTHTEVSCKRCRGANAVTRRSCQWCGLPFTVNPAGTEALTGVVPADQANRASSTYASAVAATQATPGAAGSFSKGSAPRKGTDWPHSASASPMAQGEIPAPEVRCPKCMSSQTSTNTICVHCGEVMPAASNISHTSDRLSVQGGLGTSPLPLEPTSGIGGLGTSGRGADAGASLTASKPGGRPARTQPLLPPVHGEQANSSAGGVGHLQRTGTLGGRASHQQTSVLLPPQGTLDPPRSGSDVPGPGERNLSATIEVALATRPNAREEPGQRGNHSRAQGRGGKASGARGRSQNRGGPRKKGGSKPAIILLTLVTTALLMVLGLGVLRTGPTNDRFEHIAAVPALASMTPDALALASGGATPTAHSTPRVASTTRPVSGNPKAGAAIIPPAPGVSPVPVQGAVPAVPGHQTTGSLQVARLTSRPTYAGSCYMWLAGFNTSLTQLRQLGAKPDVANAAWRSSVQAGVDLIRQISKEIRGQDGSAVADAYSEIHAKMLTVANHMDSMAVLYEEVLRSRDPTSISAAMAELNLGLQGLSEAHAAMQIIAARERR